MSGAQSSRARREDEALMAVARSAMEELVLAARSHAAENGVGAVAHEIALRGGNEELRNELRTRIIDAANKAVADHPGLADKLARLAAAEEMGRGTVNPSWQRLPYAERQGSVAMFIAVVLTHECLLQARQASTTHPDPKEVKQ